MSLLARQSSALILLAVGFLLMCRVTLAQGTHHWAYEGDSGPEHWGSLAPEFATCASGTAQSPIDIPASAALSSPDISFAYQPSLVNIVNNGHTVQVNYDAGSAITLDGVKYDLVQFHFHAASEHAIAGQHTPLEIHLVHRSAEGDLAVIGILLTSGTENPAYAPVLQNLPQQAGDPATVAGASVDASQLLPAQRSYWRYAGSLTTPPCSEGVKWFVMSRPVELSDAQIAAFTSIYPNNSRPLQPLLARMVGTPVLPNTGGTELQADETLIALGTLLIIGGLGLSALNRERAA
jgi:carbonic anhydrase